MLKKNRWICLNFIGQLVSLVFAYVVFSLSESLWLGVFMALAVMLFSSLLISYFVFGFFSRFLKTTELALLHLKDGEFSLKIPDQRDSQLQRIVDLFHEVTDSFHKERSSLLQRELLLDRVFETVSSALLLTDGREKVVLSNPTARQLLRSGKPVKGLLLSDILSTLTPTLADSIAQKKEILLTLDGKGGEPEIWHLSCELFRLNGQQHTLYHFKQMTRTLSRAEVDTWKKVIRVISHELNNSLGPISSLAHSGKHILTQLALPENEERMLTQIFSTMEHSTTTLTTFLSNYAEFSRLPTPMIKVFSWSKFLKQLNDLVSFQIVGDLPAHKGRGDVGQLTQMFINLIKNALEAGSSPSTVCIAIVEQGKWDRISVLDQGCGMQEAQLSQALIPFYSTKHNGTGLGLSLCREMVDAHNGRITLANRNEGGLEVTIWLPAHSGSRSSIL